MLKLMTVRPIGAGTSSATLKFPFGIEVEYHDSGEWGTVYFGRRLRIGWKWQSAIPGRRGEVREVYVTTNSTPWGIPHLLGRVLYVGRMKGKWRVFPDADEYALWRYLRPYVVMRQWVKWPDNEENE